MSQPIDKAFVEILPDLDEFANILDRKLSDIFDKFSDAVDDALDDVEDRFDSMARDITDSVDDAVDDIDRSLDQIDGRELDVKVDIDDRDLNKKLDGIKSKAASVGKVLLASLRMTTVVAGVLALAGALTNVIGGLTGFVAALAPAAGILVAVPAVIAGAALAMGTLKLAISGVGDALKAGLEGDIEKFNEALKELSPAAQTFAKDLVALKPAFDTLKKSVQEAFFKPFADQVGELSNRVLPLLQAQLPRVSAALGGIVRQFIEAAKTGPLLGGVSDVLSALVAGFGRLTPVVKPFVDAIGTLLSVGSGFLTDLIGGVGSLAQSFSTFIQDTAQSGQLAEFLQNAIDTIAQLGRVLGNVGSIFNSIFGALNQGGAGALATLERLTGGVADFLDSAEGATGLQSLFSILNTLGDAVGDSLGILLPALAAGLQALAPAAGPLAIALVAISKALAPLLPLLGTVLATAITNLSIVFTALSNALGPTIKLVAGELSKAFVELAPVAAQLLTALAPLAGQLGVGLAKAFTPLAKLIPIVAKALVDSLLPHLPTLLDAFEKLVPVIVELAEEFSGQLVEAILDLIPELPGLVDSMVQLALAVADLVVATAPITAIFIQIVGFVLKVTTSFGGLIIVAKVLTGVFSGVAGAFTFLTDTVGPALATFFSETLPSALSAVGTFFTETIPGWIDTAIGFFAGIPGRVGAALAALPGVVGAIVQKMIDDFFFRVGVGIGAIIFLFTEFPKRALNAIKELGPKLAAFFTGVFNSEKQRATTNLTNIVAFFQALPQRIASAISSLGQRISSIFTSAMNNGRNAVTGGINAIIAGFNALPGRISAFAGRLTSAGANLGRAIGNGLSNIGGFASDIGGKIVSRVKSGVNSIIGSINRGIGSIDAVLPGGLPRLPYLARGGVALGPAIVGEAGKELALPLESERTRDLLASVMPKNMGGGITFGPGAVVVSFEGVVPTEQEAFTTGQAVGEGIANRLATAGARRNVRML